jgi:tetratricopeptide (TPR) repeat protein
MLSTLPSRGLAFGFVVWLGTTCLFAQEQNAGSKPKLDLALETSAQTGRPVLIVGARDTCGLCKSFLAELQTDPRARAATGQFVSLKLDVDDPAEWSPAARKYPYQGGLLPIILIVRADGEQLYGNAGAPPQAAAFLFEQLKKAGTVLNPKQLEQVRESAEKAQALVEAGKIDQAVSLMKRHLETGSYAAPAVELQKLADELSAKAKDALAAAEQAMNDEPHFEAALAFAETERLYSELPEVGNAIKDKEKEYRKNPAWVDLLNQAEIFTRAQAFADDGKNRQALALFQSLQEKYPGSPAAGKAGEEIAKLDQTPETSVSTAAVSTEDSADVKRAASYLRFGKTFQGKDAEKARKYFEKVIETAPDSDLAAEARQLLEKLP